MKSAGRSWGNIGVLNNYLYYFEGSEDSTSGVVGDCQGPQCSFATRQAIITGLHSPSWHRRARLRRSLARGRVRQAQAQGLQPRRKDLALLRRHHSRPQYRTDMGRGWGYNKGGGHPSNSAYWQYWDGTWSSSQRRNPKGGNWKTGKTETNTPYFPAYDARSQDTTVPKGGKGHGEHQDSWAMDASEPVEDMVTLVQSQINYTRKAEARVRNLEAARVKKENMWNKYFDELKKAYVRELSRYQKAMNKIDQDLAAATAARDEARRALQQFDFRKIGEEDSQATEELALEWHALTKSWAKEQEAASEQTAMHRPHLPFPGMSPGMGLAPAPMMGMPNGAMMTPDAAARLFLATIAGQPMMSDQASVPATAAMPPSSAEERTDKPAEPEQGHVPAGAGTAPPYVPSPSARTCDAPSPPVKPPQRSRQRLPIKGQPLHPVHTQVPVPATLADKLAAKRSVMKPFCKTEEGAVASAGPLEARPDSAGPPEQQDIEVIMSGGDTDDEPPPIPKGPSLDGLG